MSNLIIWEEINLQNVISSLNILGVYFLYMFLATKFLPGKIVQGFPDQKGKIYTYRINGLQLLFLTEILYIIGYNYFGFRLSDILKHFWSFFVATNIISFLISFILLIEGRMSKFYRPHQQSWTPQLFNDWWFGATQNPRFMDVDLKMFFYQPSLIGLQLFIFAFGEYQYINNQKLTANMLIYQIFWNVWFITHYVREDFMLSTWDIIAENFGFMLTWGDLVYLPYLYGIGGWYLSTKSNSSDWRYLILVIVLHVCVHYMYRTANWQKYEYRRKGQNALIWGKKPVTLENKLLVSGWWGIGRHLNYTGEILVYLTIALCSEFDSFLPYVLPLSLFLMLIHRAARDDARCKQKYGKLWDQYCSQVKFKMIPYIY